VRIVGEVKMDYADLLRRADAIFIEEPGRTAAYSTVSFSLGIWAV
jgi:GMP synthase PP-ATPase subunit